VWGVGVVCVVVWGIHYRSIVGGPPQGSLVRVRLSGTWEWRKKERGEGRRRELKPYGSRCRS